MNLPAASRELPPHAPARLACDDVEHTHLRALVNPMQTVLASLFEVVGGWRRGADDRWVASMLRRAEGIDLSPLAMFAAEERVVPNTLMPVPARSGMSWDAAVAEVAALPAEATRDEIVGMLSGSVPSPALQAWIDDPVTMLAQYLEALNAWWRAVVRPEWRRIEALLESEVLRLGRVLAVEGPGAALASVHPRIQWRDGELRLPSAPVTHCNFALEQRMVVLLPMACGHDGVIVGLDRPGLIVVAYAAPGTAALFRHDDQPATDALADLLGGGRAAVLRALDGPRPMRDIGADVGLASSTICEHLQGLAKVELVQRTRMGRNVIYTRTPRGDRLVALF